MSEDEGIERTKGRVIHVSNHVYSALTILKLTWGKKSYSDVIAKMLQDEALPRVLSRENMYMVNVSEEREG